MRTLRDSHRTTRSAIRQAIETARCLHEKVLTSVHEANIGSIFGIGFAAWTGGALRFIYRDMPRFFVRADGLARRRGLRFAVSAEVRAPIERFEPRYD